LAFLSVSAIAAIALAVIPTEIVAQQKTLKDQLVGVWTLVSAETIEPNGTKFPLVKGSPIKGFQVFTADGKVSFQIIGDHAKVGSNDRMKMTPEEMKASAESLLSYFGTYTVNEAENSYTVRIESSSFSEPDRKSRQTHGRVEWRRPEGDQSWAFGWRSDHHSVEAGQIDCRIHTVDIESGSPVLFGASRT